MKLRNNNQLTLPAKIINHLGLKVGDDLDFKIVDGTCYLVPMISAPRDPEWFMNDDWLADEHEIDAEIQALKKSGQWDKQGVSLDKWLEGTHLNADNQRTIEI